jgi:DNA-binding LacI/PurR family transcriptional regulator
MSTRISLDHIARQTGYSKSAVSLALRDDSRMRLKTRQKIREAAQALGYRPNPILASLASNHFRGTGQAKGTPLAYIRFPEFNDPFIRLGEKLVVTEGQDYAKKLGYHLEEFEVADFKDGAHLSRVLFARGVQGILLPQLFRASLLKGLDWKCFSVVALGENLAEPAVSLPPVPCASVDHFGLIMRVWGEAWKRGYRRIGFVLLEHHPSLVDDELRRGAIAVCQSRIPARLRIPSLVWTKGKGVEKMMPDWARRYRPDVVAGFNDWIHACLLEAGFRVPEEIGFITLHSKWGEPQRTDPTPYSGMREMVADKIHAAIEVLDQQIRHHHSGLDPRARTQLIHSEWMEGTTLPPRAVVM